MSELGRVLEAARAYEDQAERTLALAERIRRGAAVRRILIHLDRRSPTAGFRQFGPRLVPIFNYFQAALVLFEDRVLSSQQVLFVAREMLLSPEHTVPTLANSLQDLLRRGRVSRTCADALITGLQTAAAGAADDEAHRVADGIASAFAARVKNLGGATQEHPAENPRLDYVALVDKEFHHRRDKGRRSLRR
jgi:hypothetical protein